MIPLIRMDAARDEIHLPKKYIRQYVVIVIGVLVVQHMDETFDLPSHCRHPSWGCFFELCSVGGDFPYGGIAFIQHDLR
jgi:hypothetical protein